MSIFDSLKHELDEKETIALSLVFFAFLAVAFGFALGTMLTKLQSMTVVELPK
jgi:hypothetical protein